TNRAPNRNCSGFNRHRVARRWGLLRNRDFRPRHSAPAQWTPDCKEQNHPSYRTMKKWIASFMLVLFTAYPLAGFGETSVEKAPAYLPIDEVLDLKTIRPEVNLNLPRFLLKDALSELNSSTNGSPIEGLDIADLIKDVKLIRVVVIEANQTNR